MFTEVRGERGTALPGQAGLAGPPGNLLCKSLHDNHTLALIHATLPGPMLCNQRIAIWKCLAPPVAKIAAHKGGASNPGLMTTVWRSIARELRHTHIAVVELMGSTTFRDPNS